MQSFLLWLAVAAITSKPVTSQTTPGRTTPPPDLVLLHGNILTVDAKDSIAQAVAIREGKIIAVGSDSDIQALVTAATKVIDLHGRTATPGLIDSHGHFADGGVNELYHVDLSRVGRIDEVLGKLREKATTLRPGEWLQGDGWDEGKLEERRYLYASDLDKATPNNPVWLTHTTGHYGVANSYAMKLAHITAQTQAPPAGTIDRDPQGLPTGVLKESAMSLVTKLIPETTPDQERNGILHIIEELHQEGMTAVKDADIQPHTWDAYSQLYFRWYAEDRKKDVPEPHPLPSQFKDRFFVPRKALVFVQGLGIRGPNQVDGQHVDAFAQHRGGDGQSAISRTRLPPRSGALSDMVSRLPSAAR